MATCLPGGPEDLDGAVGHPLPVAIGHPPLPGRSGGCPKGGCPIAARSRQALPGRMAQALSISLTTESNFLDIHLRAFASFWTSISQTAFGHPPLPSRIDGCPGHGCPSEHPGGCPGDGCPMAAMAGQPTISAASAGSSNGCAGCARSPSAACGVRCPGCRIASAHLCPDESECSCSRR